MELNEWKRIFLIKNSVSKYDNEVDVKCVKKSVDGDSVCVFMEICFLGRKRGCGCGWGKVWERVEVNVDLRLLVVLRLFN